MNQNSPTVGSRQSGDSSSQAQALPPDPSGTRIKFAPETPHSHFSPRHPPFRLRTSEFLRLTEAGPRLLPALLLASLLPLAAFSQSLWQEGVSRSMFADKRASGVGDLITIVVQENTTASKSDQTATSKKTSMDAAISSFLYSPAASSLLTKGGQMPALKYAMDHSFSGGGTINNSEQIVAQVTVHVVDVLPNRNMIIEGNRETAFGGEKQHVTLRGIIRPDDVQANNTVYSYNVSDAKIEIVTKGSITDSQKRGWFTWLWEKVSPF
jgi:flagellar L-ring protein FlgH